MSAGAGMPPRRGSLPVTRQDVRSAIEACYWEVTSLGAPETWPQYLRTLVTMMLGSRQPMFILWGADRTMIYNGGYAAILGARHPKSLGLPFAEVWPHLAAEASAIIDKVCAGEAVHSEDLTFATRRTGYSGEVRYSFSCTPIHDEADRVVGTLWVYGATEMQEREEQHLRFRLELDKRLRYINDPRKVMAVTAELLGRHLIASRVNYGYIEDTPDGEIFIVERDWTDGKAPSLVGQYPVSGFGASLINVLKAGNTVCLHDAFDDQLTAGEGIAATYVAIGARSGITVPLIKGGRMEAALLVHQVEPRHWREDEEVLVRQVAERTWEAVERARVETALRESEERMRDILESINDAFYAVDREWRFTYVNRKTEELWRRKRESLMGKTYWDEFPEIVGSEPYKAHIAAMERRIPIRLETMSPLNQQWLEISIFPTADGGLSIYFRDVSDRKSAEEHRELLIHELNHRVKNTLATVQSIAAQTLRDVGVTQESRTALEARLLALSRAHDVLTRENWEGASLREIVAQSIEPYRGVGESRLRGDGPEVRLSPRMALALAMALQELATNAVKHGALSNASGRVEIVWSLDDTVEPARLHLRWEEKEGMPIQPPQRRGFGTRLIERSLASDLQGNVKIDFAPTGVVCTIDAPMDEGDLPVHRSLLKKSAFAA
ncbi:HWE histidine kinase domain-containing protein [Microvirga guangxiensis]|uniref:Blue-light-activated histidine kinase n=1 Tax=Microvirga guangxiensis TaxID=549386 RepID=A0A1G5HTS9_9HYPH|nr:HWE histidine kinase domain-containing protein [Microvirga guangxiensis]SCY67265.1 PAS domain S-box-containing protein [Microvirga guangxiensis]